MDLKTIKILLFVSGIKKDAKKINIFISYVLLKALIARGTVRKSSLKTYECTSKSYKHALPISKI